MKFKVNEEKRKFFGDILNNFKNNKIKTNGQYSMSPEEPFNTNFDIFFSVTFWVFRYYISIYSGHGF